MLGWTIFKHAVLQITDGLSDALRVSLIPFIIAGAASWWLTSSYPDLSLMALDPEMMQAGEIPPGFVNSALGVGFLSLFLFTWVAVAWHRRTLLGEPPAGWVPPFNGGLVLGYLGRTLLLGLAIGLIMLAAGTMVAVLLYPLFGLAAQPLVSATSLFIALLLFYRLGVVLPAGAIGRRMSFGEAMRETSGHSRTAIVLALLTVGFTFLLEVPTLLDTAPDLPEGEMQAAGPITVIYQIVVQWIALMVGVGTLTVLYGHVVEGRPLE
ncbi:hypothetical protein jaqu_12100 [Jannaschia aquimarina]|uniref:Uncharacterized protein n=2 Tax=Jannaschia aquimarina TaxID=935700 RepID=A0A0D1EMU5_9RHOB|nr:hypothetical protein jaqu_12100 [Jannaschia aquimarina]SNS81622.1 hypothetical protein SAMN05421775_102413 [Jannaschia aquimarina]